MAVNKQILDELKSTLEKQLNLARQGKVDDVKSLADRAGLLMEKVIKLGILKLPEFKNYREKLQRLYKELCLTLAVQKDKIAEDLNQVRKVKKAIVAYRSSFQSPRDR